MGTCAIEEATSVTQECSCTIEICEKVWALDLQWLETGLFSDETKINKFNFDGRSSYWISDGASIQPHQVCQIEAWWWLIYDLEMHDFLWTSFYVQNRSKDGSKPIQMHSQILFVLNYTSIQLRPTKRSFLYDNDPKHTARSVQQWLQTQPFQLLQWPAQSLDFNPIEHL